MRLLFAGILSILFIGLMVSARLKKKRPLKPMVFQFSYGMLLAIPFITIELLSGHIRPILLFPIVFLEFLALFCEEHIAFLDHSIKRSLAHLGLLSYIIIGLGFTYTELLFFIFHTEEVGDVMAYGPFKMIFAIAVHTSLFLSVGVAALGHKIWNIVKYYLDIAHIGFSHFLYLFFAHAHVSYLFVPLLVINILLMAKHLNVFRMYVKDLRMMFGVEQVE